MSVALLFLSMTCEDMCSSKKELKRCNLKKQLLAYSFFVVLGFLSMLHEQIFALPEFTPAHIFAHHGRRDRLIRFYIEVELAWYIAELGLLFITQQKPNGFELMLAHHTITPPLIAAGYLNGYSSATAAVMLLCDICDVPLNICTTFALSRQAI